MIGFRTVILCAPVSSCLAGGARALVHVGFHQACGRLAPSHRREFCCPNGEFLPIPPSVLYITMRSSCHTDYEYCRIDGNTPHDTRQDLIEDYNAPVSGAVDAVRATGRSAPDRSATWPLPPLMRARFMLLRVYGLNLQAPRGVVHQIPVSATAGKSHPRQHR